MSLIELLIVIFSIVGAIKGANLGFSLHRLVGLILGIPFGFLGGASLIIVSLIFIIFLLEVSENMMKEL